MPEPDDQRMVAELTAFAEAYRAAEVEGSPTQAVSFAGWHAGARTRPNTATGNLLVHNDSGAEAQCSFREGQDPLFGITRAGNVRDFTQRPFAVWSVTPDLSGALAPHAARLELISANGAAIEADVVAGTFALESDLDLASVRRLNERLEAGTATMDDKMAAVFEGGDEAVEKMRHLTVRVYDSAEALLYDGPALIDDEHWPVKR